MEKEKKKTSSKKRKITVGFAVMTIIGIILFIYGCTIETPSDRLSVNSTYDLITQAELVGHKIVASRVERAIFICTGVFMITFGAACIEVEERREQKNTQTETEENNTEE